MQKREENEIQRKQWKMFLLLKHFISLPIKANTTSSPFLKTIWFTKEIFSIAIIFLVLKINLNLIFKFFSKEKRIFFFLCKECLQKAYSSFPVPPSHESFLFFLSSLLCCLLPKQHPLCPRTSNNTTSLYVDFLEETKWIASTNNKMAAGHCTGTAHIEKRLKDIITTTKTITIIKERRKEVFISRFLKAFMKTLDCLLYSIQKNRALCWLNTT